MLVCRAGIENHGKLFCVSSDIFSRIYIMGLMSVTPVLSMYETGEKVDSLPS